MSERAKITDGTPTYRPHEAGAPGSLSGFVTVLAFVPVLGVLFAPIAIIWGLLTWQAKGRKMAVWGAGGLAFNFAFLGLFFGASLYLMRVQRGGIFDGMRTNFAQMQLNSLVKDVELYKLVRGTYPGSLEELKTSLPPQSLIVIEDPINALRHGSRTKLFYYRVVGERYYLRSVGNDEQPFTPDDVIPQLDPAATAKFGLLLAPPT
jgi:hypothetical protein